MNSNLSLRRYAILLGAFLAFTLLCGPAAAQGQPEGRPCTAEPTDMTIAIDDLVSCSINPTGDTDSFRFSAQAGDLVAFQVTRLSGGEPQIEVFDPAGTRIGGPVTSGCCSQFVRLELRLNTSGTYTIRITDWGSDAPVDYLLAINRLNPLTSAATSIGYGARVNGEINPRGDVDFYTFWSAGNEQIIIQGTRQTGGEIEFELWSPAGTRVAGPVTSGCCSQFARIDYLTTTAGVYTIRTSDWGSDAPVNYLLAVDRTGPPSPLSIPLQFGVGVNGAVTPKGDAQYYTFWGSGGSTVTIQATRLAAGETEIELLNALGVRVAGPATSGCCAQFARLDVPLTATGVYSIRTTDWGSDATVSYRMEVQCLGNCAADPRAALTSPAPGSTFTSNSPIFTWTAGTGASKYWLDVGNSAGSGDISAGETTATSRTVNNVPTDGRTIYARLWTFIGATWQTPIDYTFHACTGACGAVDLRAVLISPAPGSAFTSNSATFTWTAGTGASKYWLDVGNSAGSGDISAGETTATSRTVNTLPTDGRTIYVRLWTYVGGAWQTPIDYTYTAATTGGSACPDPRATLTGPPRGTSLSASPVTFTWTNQAACGATQYWLDVGTNVGVGDIYAANQNTGVSRTVNIPLNGRLVLVRLWTFVGGAWQTPLDYAYNTDDPRATIIGPLPGSTLPGSSAAFCWTSVSGATQYWLDVGTTPGSGNLSAGAQTAACKAVSNVLPTDGRTVYVRLWTFRSGAWQTPIDYTYRTGDPRAVLLTPAPGSTIASTSVTFTWTPGGGATEYWLDIGNAVGSGGIYGVNQGLATSRTVTNIPADGRTLYVRLWTFRNGAWQTPIDYTFPTRTP